MPNQEKPQQDKQQQDKQKAGQQKDQPGQQPKQAPSKPTR